MVGKNQAAPKEETIYNLIPPANPPPIDLSRYKSKFKANVIESYKKGKFERKTMGCAEEIVPDPQHFLRRKIEKPIELTRQKEARPATVVPIREMPQVAEKTEKNFIQLNALEVVMAVPKQPEKNRVDDRHGDKFPLENSGLIPKYLKKKVGSWMHRFFIQERLCSIEDFGEVPNYVHERNNQLEKAKREYEAFISERLSHGHFKEMNEDDRQTILQGLKRHWDGIYHQYQRLSVITDTVPKRINKERLEREMQSIERDIELLEKHRVIYIAD